VKRAGAGARTVTCATCRHFTARPDLRPDGWCGRYATETWGEVPFACPGYQPADEAEVRREVTRQEVLARLEAHPSVKRAFTTRFEGDMLIVTLAVRGIGTCELAIPPERFSRDDLADFEDLATTPSGRA